jgi:hypothetical protein
MSRVVIKRNDYPMDYLRDYQVYVDDNKIGKVSNDSIFTFEIVKPSKVELKIDWCKSNSLFINPKENDTIKLEVKSSVKGWRFLFVWLYWSAFRNKYLELKNITN